MPSPCQLPTQDTDNTDDRACCHQEPKCCKSANVAKYLLATLMLCWMCVVTGYLIQMRNEHTQVLTAHQDKSGLNVQQLSDKIEALHDKTGATFMMLNDNLKQAFGHINEWMKNVDEEHVQMRNKIRATSGGDAPVLPDELPTLTPQE